MSVYDISFVIFVDIDSDIYLLVRTLKWMTTFVTKFEIKEKIILITMRFI